MNERIKQLIDQSYDEVPHERDWDAVTRIFNQEKFAELIVRECLDLLNDPDVQPFLNDWKHLREQKSLKEYATGWVEGVNVYGWKIKQHFGVKE